MRNASKHIYLFDHYRGLPRQDVDEEGLLLRVLFKIFEDDLVVEQVLGETRDVDLLVFALCDGLHRGKRLVGKTECKPLVLAELWIRWRLLAALFLCQWKAGAHGVGLVEVTLAKREETSAFNKHTRCRDQHATRSCRKNAVVQPRQVHSLLIHSRGVRSLM